MKNMTVGGLTVAAEHGNFLLNRGHASFADLQRLENEIKSRRGSAHRDRAGKGSDLRRGGRKKILNQIAVSG